MSFIVAADGYDRFIGRYSRELAPLFLDFTRLPSGPVLDVGCGPGGLTGVLARRFGAASVAAVDPSQPFVAACRERVPGADVRLGPGEQLPFEDDQFQGALSQLVLAFVSQPERVVAEMRRVVKSGGTVAACMFEANGFALVRTFWNVALSFDSEAPDDAKLPFRRMGELIRAVPALRHPRARNDNPSRSSRVRGLRRPVAALRFRNRSGRGLSRQRSPKTGAKRSNERYSSSWVLPERAFPCPQTCWQSADIA